jgi:dihydroflavonol-4-reductase
VFTSTAGTRRTSGIATETDIATPVGAYQESKARAETVVDDAVDAGLDAVTVHPTSVFGPHDEAFTARLFTLASNPAMIAYVPGGASLVDIRDVVSGLRSAMDHGETGEHYILGGENLTFRAALSTIAEQIDGYAPRIPVPGPVLTAAGYVASALDNRLGVRVFPFTPEMGRLATSELFYSSKKAMDELGYTYRPLTEAVEPAAQWFQNR